MMIKHLIWANDAVFRQSLQGLKSFIYMVILCTVLVYVSKDLGGAKKTPHREGLGVQWEGSKLFAVFLLIVFECVQEHFVNLSLLNYTVFSETGGSIPLAEAEGKTMVSSFNCPQSMYMWVWFEKGALQILMGIDPCVFPKWNLKVIYKTYQRRNIHTQLHFTYILIITTVYIYMYINIYVYTYIYICPYIYMYIYIYRCTYTHTYIYIWRLLSKQSPNPKTRKVDRSPI